ncbi:hypothetical protein FHU38_000977 [Saccharomonospora amisosensis]|uniref:Uncharacterized protein n=1 Tax=Saccharomonospora amisosensis TaxID=1128677 RepID=A0A7X5UN32_9PSEU|nr:hypothetical protein [Saccharomonospora amisosensis]NIJ10633.1 hypothetical protein [Saccharomonospora amisosensis]
MGDDTVGERLATIETKLDLLIVKRDDHEIRLRKLERWAWVVAGAAGAIGGSIARLLPATGG